MLISIQKSVLDILNSNEGKEMLNYKQRIDTALFQLVHGHNRHRHIILGDKRDTLDGLKEYYNCKKNDDNIYNELYEGFRRITENYTTAGRAIKELFEHYFYVRVVCCIDENSNEYDNMIDDTHININILTCPNQKFDFFYNKTILLLENNDDYKIYYKPITTNYIEKNIRKVKCKYVQNITFDCEQKQTGGSSVQSAIETEITDMSHFVFGFTDSDKEYGTIPSSKKQYYTSNSKTCKKFESIKNLLSNTKDINNFLYDCYTLKVRDIENLVSLDMLMPYSSKNTIVKIKRIKRLIQDDPSKEEKFYKYFDYEKGIYDNQNDLTSIFKDVAKNPIKKICQDKNNKQFFSNDSTISGLPLIVENEWKKIGMAFFQRCFKNQKSDVIQFWTEVLNISDSDLPIEGVGRKEDMKKSFKDCEATFYSEYTKLPIVLKKEWDEIGKIIFSRCCIYINKTAKNV